MFYCKFCKHKIIAGITRLKHHLIGTKKGVKICAQPSANVKQARKDMLLATRLKKESLLCEIGRMGEPQEDVVSQEMESTIGNNSQPRIFDPMNKFINLEARQSTLESSYKEAREKCARKIARSILESSYKEAREKCVGKIARCIYTLELSFNIIQTSY